MTPDDKVIKKSTAPAHIAIFFTVYLVIFIILDSRAHTFEVYPGIVAWYPPDGLSFAFLLALGALFLPALAIASFISSFLVFQLPLPLSELISWAIIISTAFGIAAWFLRSRVRIDIRLRSTRDLLWLIASAAMVSALLGIISVSTSVATGVIPYDQRLWAGLQWWIGEMIGILVLTPALLIHLVPHVKRFVDGETDLEPIHVFSKLNSPWTIAQILSIFITVYLAAKVSWPNNFHPFFLIAIPPIWIAVQHGLSGSSLANILVNFGITWAARGNQNFNPQELGQLQFMMLIVFCSSLLIGSIVSEGNQLKQSSIAEIERRGKKIIYEIIIIAVLVMSTWILEYTFDFFHVISDWGTLNHISVVEETLASIMIMGLSLGVFSYRRWKEVQNEISERGKAQAELQDLYRELEVRVQERTADLSKTNELLTTEITERKQAEDALARSEKRFRSLIENSLDAITLLDATGVAIYDSPAAPGMLGYERDELVGQNIFGLLHEEDLVSIQSLFRELIETPGGRLNKNFRFRHRSGSWRWLESVSTNLLAEPSVKAIVVNYRDITERMQTEQTLQNAQKLYQTLFEQSADAVFILDLEGRHVEANQRATEMLGYSHDELLHLSARDVSAEVNQSVDVLSKLLNGEIMKTYERVFRRKDGSLLDVEPHVTLIHDEHGQPFHIQSIVRDISERKRAEAEIQTRTKELLTLYDLSRALADANDLDKILEIVNRQTVDSTHITFARIALLENDHLVTRSVYPVRVLEYDLLMNCEYPIDSVPYCKQVLEQDQPVILRSSHQRLNDSERAILLLDFTQTICLIPLRVHGNDSNSSRLLGLLMLGEVRKEEREPFTSEKLRLARSIGDQAAIAIDNARLFKDLQLSNIDLSLAYEATIAGWSAALDLRDKETEGHAQRVTEMTHKLAIQMGFTGQELAQARYGALLHDIGKMGVPDRILLKPDKLTDEEQEIMRMHPAYAYQMLKPINYLELALAIPYCHHEKWDGTGYPRGLKGEQIPIAAQIFAVVDVYDALVSDRPYRKSWSREKTLDYIHELSGNHFNPQIVKEFMKMMKEERKEFITTNEIR